MRRRAPTRGRVCRSRSSRPHRRTRTSPADPAASGNASSCSFDPIFQQSPRAATLVSERHQQAGGSQAALQLSAGGCCIFHNSRDPPSWPSVGLGNIQHVALSAAGVSHLVGALSGTQPSSELVAAQQLLGGGSGGPWHTASGSVAGGAAGDPECGPIWRCWWCTRAVVGPSGVRLRVSVSHYVPSGRSIDGCE